MAAQRDGLGGALLGCSMTGAGHCTDGTAGRRQAGADLRRCVGLAHGATMVLDHNSDNCG